VNYIPQFEIGNETILQEKEKRKEFKSVPKRVQASTASTTSSVSSKVNSASKETVKSAKVLMIPGHYSSPFIKICL
jgi:hypothetical protein